MYNLVLVKTHKAIYTKTIWISTKMLVVLFCVIIHFNKTFQVYPWISYINNSILYFMYSCTCHYKKYLITSKLTCT